MQHKIFTTIVISVFALLSLKAQVAVDESNFSLHIIAALNADWSSVAGDGTLTSDDIATINNLTITGKGSGDELSLKGIDILTAVETLSLNTLKYGGDFSVLPEGTSNLECHGCVIDKFEIYGDLVSLIISDKTTFNDILLSGSQGHKIENIELRNLDIEDFDPTLKSDYRLEGYLKIIDCRSIKHANLRIASSLNMNGVPELADMDWDTMYTKFGESSTNIIELSKALGIVTDEDIYVNKRYGFKSNVTLTLPDKSTPISLDDYSLSASRVSSISGPMTKDEGSNTLIIDWEAAGADEASVTYRYNCLTGVSKKYLEVELTVKVGAEPEDDEAPVIKVGDDVLGATANYEESVTLTITDNKGVTSVTINGTPASEPYVIPAVDGTYEVVAKDEKGNQAKTTITIKLPV
ncbi:MAG: hypothetical protein MJZ31_10990, partial [Bacteroidales bacterium]|nr:hypothetical protein [Bacteroidales bacterium]